MNRSQDWWDYHWLRGCEWAATASKDPSTKVGALIIRPDKTIASFGYNGFARGIADDHRLHDRKEKYPRMIHAEKNAIYNSNERLHGYTIYTWPMHPCHECATAIIQKGIVRVVSPPTWNERWEDSIAEARKDFKEAGVISNYL